MQSIIRIRYNCGLVLLDGTNIVFIVLVIIALATLIECYKNVGPNQYGRWDFSKQLNVDFITRINEVFYGEFELSTVRRANVALVLGDAATRLARL